MFEAHITPSSVATLVLSEGRKDGVEAKQCPPFTAAVKNGWSYIPTSLYAFISRTGTTLLLRSKKFLKLILMLKPSIRNPVKQKISVFTISNALP